MFQETSSLPSTAPRTPTRAPRRGRSTWAESQHGPTEPSSAHVAGPAGGPPTSARGGPRSRSRTVARGRRDRDRDDPERGGSSGFPPGVSVTKVAEQRPGEAPPLIEQIKERRAWTSWSWAPVDAGAVPLGAARQRQATTSLHHSPVPVLIVHAEQRSEDRSRPSETWLSPEQQAEDRGPVNAKRPERQTLMAAEECPRSGPWPIPSRTGAVRGHRSRAWASCLAGLKETARGIVEAEERAPPGGRERFERTEDPELQGELGGRGARTQVRNAS